jgi:hypothetical protein
VHLTAACLCAARCGYESQLTLNGSPDIPRGGAEVNRLSGSVATALPWGEIALIAAETSDAGTLRCTSKATCPSVYGLMAQALQSDAFANRFRTGNETALDPGPEPYSTTRDTSGGGVGDGLG